MNRRMLFCIVLGIIEKFACAAADTGTFSPIIEHAATANVQPVGLAAVQETITVLPVHMTSGASGASPESTSAKAVYVASRCPDGFVYSNGWCANINECTMGTHRCSPESVCTDTIGSYKCACQAGFTGDGTDCTPVDPCTDETLNTCSQHATCTSQLDGSVTCNCNTGYEGNGETCTEIPVIDKGPCDDPYQNNCSDNALCEETSDSNHTCTCNAGFTGDGILCMPFDDGSDNNDNVTIICDPGFEHGTLKGKESCVDIDECETSVHACAKDANCTNTLGSYTCNCQDGFDGDGSLCKLPGCSAGLTESATGECVDIDECATGQHDCTKFSLCTNYQGGFSCACAPGFLSSADGLTCVKNLKCKPGSVLDGKQNCVDDNECTGGKSNCDMNAFCENTNGSFTCTCRNGYTGDGLNCTSMITCQTGYAELTEVCVDVDECNEGTHNCHTHAKCKNVPGSFTCKCNFGYTGSGVACDSFQDIPPTVENVAFLDRRCGLCDTHARCAKENEDLFCECNVGFSGNGRACVEEGARCMPGLTLGENGTCVDIDECALGQLECPSDALCINTLGSSYCQCPEGLEMGEEKCQALTQAKFQIDQFDILPMSLM